MLIPIRVYVPTDRRPFINICLIVTISLVSLWALWGNSVWPWDVLAGFDLEHLESTDELVLDTDGLPRPVLAITSGWLHGGALHLIGNMLFLWVFGNAVEYKFRHLGYLGLYLTCGLVGGMAHYLIEGGPAVGASGAINGVMGAFLVFFPRNDVQMVWWWLGPHWFTVSAIWIVLFYVAWDLLFIVVGAQTSTAVWAHVGGFAAGFLIAFLCASRGWLRPEEDEQTLLQILGVRGR